MPFDFARVRALIFEVPRQAKLAYCLLRDDRVPAAPKAALLAAVGIIVSPIDFPAWIPVLGELDMFALGVLATKVFIEACPDELVEDHRRAMERGESLFDQDLHALVGLAREGAFDLVARWRARRRPRVVRQEESA
jgi:uncharacterized membrane protein YkvA (DUF1232 family)